MNELIPTAGGHMSTDGPDETQAMPDVATVTANSTCPTCTTALMSLKKAEQALGELAWELEGERKSSARLKAVCRILFEEALAKERASSTVASGAATAPGRTSGGTRERTFLFDDGGTTIETPWPVQAVGDQDSQEPTAFGVYHNYRALYCPVSEVPN